MGYGVDARVQAPTILTAQGIPVTLIGKVADIVANDGGTSISCVPTAECFKHTIAEFERMDKGFLCTNVQETDLAGHSQSSASYREILECADAGIADLLSLMEEEDVLVVMADHGNDPNIGHSKHTRECSYREILECADAGIADLLSLMEEEDVLVVMADHGNDPNIGHSKHTRECVPLLVYQKGISGRRLGVRETLSDVGATVCSCFGVSAPQNGTPFWNMEKENI